MMHMSFYLSPNLTSFLFEKWNISSAGGMVWTCFVIGVMVLILECVKLLQVYFYKKSEIKLHTASSSERSITEDPLLPSLVMPPTITHLRNKRMKLHVTQSLLHILQLVIGYFVMLAVMTYNGWIGISVVIASAIGFYIFGAMRFVMSVPPIPDLPSQSLDVDATTSGTSATLQDAASSSVYS